MKTESGACAGGLRGVFSWRAETPSTDTLRCSAPQPAVPKGARSCAGTPAETTSSPKPVCPGKLISSAYFGLKNSVLHRLLWSLEPVLKDNPRCTMWRYMGSQQSPAFAFHLLWLSMFVTNWLCIPPGEYCIKTKILKLKSKQIWQGKPIWELGVLNCVFWRMKFFSASPSSLYHFYTRRKVAWESEVQFLFKLT